MLNQHHNLVVPETDYLQVGECIVDVPRRDVSAPQSSVPRRITLKALQVLLVLVAHQGKVVSREALLEWVWADTMPSDDVLTQAITQLRKAFGDDRDAPRYLETIAKGGYRLVAPVQWIEQPPAPDLPMLAPVPAAQQVTQDIVTPANSVPPPRRNIALPAAIVAGLLAVVAAGALWLQRGQRAEGEPRASTSSSTRSAAVPAAYQRITSLPGSELWPSLSPDGSQVVYSAYAPGGEQATLMVQTTAPVAGRSLTGQTPGVQDVMPAWSPNGREIAFMRIGPKERCSLMLIPASGGDPRNVSPCRPGNMGGFSWHPDGRHLVTSETPVIGDDGAVYVVDLADGRWTPLSYSKAARDIDMSPVYSPDGKWIAFHRNISLSDLWRVPATGGTPERLTRLKTNIFALAWAPDGRSIIFSRYLDGAAQLSRLDLATREVTDLGVPDSTFPTISANGQSLAFVVVQWRSALYSLDLPGNARAQPTPVFPSTGKDLLPSVSPDGTQIAFMSDRSASIGVWWARLGQPDSLRLIEGVIPVPRYSPVWSGDSGRMLVIGRTDSGLALYEIAPESGSVQRLPVPAGEPVQAEYVPDSNRILVVTERDAGRLGVTLYDRSNTPWRALATLEDVAMTRVDTARQRILFTRPTSPGLWEASLQLGAPRQISKRPDIGAGRRLVVTQDGVHLAGVDAHCGLQWVTLPEVPGTTPVCLHEAPLGAATGASLDVVNHRFYYSAEQDENADIGWMRLPAAH